MEETPDVSDAVLVGFADALIAVAQQLELRGNAARDVVSLTGTEITVIREVHREQGATATAIAAATGLQRSFVSATANRLASRGLLQHVPIGDRGVGFAPTDLALRDLEKVQQHWITRLSRADSETLADATDASGALRAIAHAMAAERDKAR